jgi:glycosyltransferase involved in cell wall biosynthesis
LRIIHIISSLSRGGRERQLAVILKNTDAKAIVFNTSAAGYAEEYNLGDRIINLKSINPIARFFEMFRILQKEKPVIIWTWGGFEATFGLLLLLVTPIRHINGSIRHGITRFNRKQIWRKFILHLSRHIVANSHAGLQANGLKRGMVLYNGLDEKFFEPLDTERYLKEQPDIHRILDKKGMVFISVANLVPYKDYFTVLKALEKLKNNGYKFIYLIIGEGPNRNAIEADILCRGLETSVYLLGRRSDVKELLSISDLFIHSSLGEGCSNAILEAMAVGLPIVASATGGTPEIVDETYGRLFGYQHWQQLYEHLECLLANPEIMKKMEQKATQKARQQFSVDNMIAEYERIIKHISKK